MLEVRNKTPFVAAIVPGLDPGGIDLATCVVKGTFVLRGSTVDPLPVADEQVPIVYGDEYAGDPSSSGLLAASEISPAKKRTDVALLGRAYARTPVESIDASLEVGPVSKTVRVVGNRTWAASVLGFASRPEPFTEMPLVWERAFGGWDGEKKTFEERNPAGVGFSTSRFKAKPNLPNLEDPKRLLSSPSDRPPPAGFGFIAPSWMPRRALAGTYDDAWRKDRCPFLPADFDEEFFQCAHPDLQAPGRLEGGEPVRAMRVTPSGELTFAVPRRRIEVRFTIKGKDETVPATIDTLLIEPDAQRVVVTWKATLRCPRNFLYIDTVRVKEVA